MLTGAGSAQHTAGISFILASSPGDKPSPLSLRQAQETRTAVASALQEGNLVSGSLSDMSKMPCYGGSMGLTCGAQILC